MLLENYQKTQHYGIDCFLDNPDLDKLLTGEGSKTAKEKFPNYATIETPINKEDKYNIWKIASKINENPDVSFFTCVADRALNNLKVEFWGDESLLNAAGLVEDNGELMLKVLTNKE